MEKTSLNFSSSLTKYSSITGLRRGALQILDHGLRFFSLSARLCKQYHVYTLSIKQNGSGLNLFGEIPVSCGISIVRQVFFSLRILSSFQNRAWDGHVLHLKRLK